MSYSEFIYLIFVYKVVVMDFIFKDDLVELRIWIIDCLEIVYICL